MKIFDNPNYNFIRWRWPALALSMIVVVAGVNGQGHANGQSNGHVSHENGHANGDGLNGDAPQVVVPSKRASAALKRALAGTRAEGVPASPDAGT